MEPPVPVPRPHFCWRRREQAAALGRNVLWARVCMAGVSCGLGELWAAATHRCKATGPCPAEANICPLTHRWRNHCPDFAALHEADNDAELKHALDFNSK